MRRIAQPAMLIVVGFFGLALVCGSLTTNSASRVFGSPQEKRDAAALYKDKCASCHGKDGRAKTFKAKFNGARNLTDPVWQGEVTDERLFNSITNGRGKMPAFGKKFSDAEIEALVAFVRGLKK